MKDALQKQKAIRYCVALGYVPYLEVLVRYSGDTSDVPSDISDIDVLGIQPAGEHASRSVIFDCKTQNKISGISRALWAAGLSQLVRADEAFVILSKAAPGGHRLAANDVKVRLFSEKLFDDFAKASSINYLEGLTYLDQSEIWESIFQLKNASRRLEPLVNFVVGDGPLEKDPAAGFRTLLARLKGAEGEFDVDKPVHRVLYGLVLTQAVVYLSGITKDFNNVFDPAMDLGKFEFALRNYIWGGNEGYLLRQRLHAAIHAGRKEDPPAFGLPGWDRFVEMQRSFLDAPLLVGSAALPLKDMAFSQMSSERPLADKRISEELLRNPRARQFALQINKYLGSLSQLLKPCSDHVFNTVTKLAAKA